MESTLTVRRKIHGDTHVATVWNTEASGPPILALHGFTGSGLDWAPLACELSRTVLAPDLLGHGASPAPDDVESYRIARVVDHCICWCEDHPKVDVIGYSMGGRVALRLASALGDRMGRLVLISTSPGIEDPQARAERIAQDYALAGTIEDLGVEWFCEHWSNQPIIQSQQNIPSAIRVPMAERRRRNRAAGLAGSLRGMGQGAVEPFWSALPELRMPVLLITGDADQRYTHMAEQYASRLNRVEHARVPNVGHCVHLEAKDAVRSIVSTFLSATE